MRIVVLDGHALNPGDLSWDGLRALGECAIHDRTPREEVVACLRDAEAAITNKVVLDKAVIEALPKLCYIGVTATGYNVVDIAAAKARGVTVTNVPAYSTDSVAQAVFALLLELTNHTGAHAETVREGRWQASKDFCYWDKPIVELSGLTMGIVGFGHIGQAVARLAHAFGMKLLVHVRSKKETAGLPVEFCGTDELFSRADVVSLHCPLTDETKELVNAKRLALMKPSAFLLNTSRGALIDEKALADALNAGRLAGAGLDVLSVEPPRADNPLLTARNCIITPHIAWATVAARRRLMDAVVGNLKAFLAGKPVNVVG